MATDFQSTTNLLNRLLEKLELNSKAPAIAGLATIISVLSLIISALISINAWSDAKEANLRSQMLTEQNAETTTRANLAFTRLGRIEAYLKAHGIDTEEIYDDVIDE